MSLAGRTTIPPDDMVVIGEMVAAVRGHKYADFLTKGEVEMSYYWRDELTGIDCQARPDCFKIVDGRGIVVDLKTTADARGTDSFLPRRYQIWIRYASGNVYRLARRNTAFPAILSLSPSKRHRRIAINIRKRTN